MTAEEKTSLARFLDLAAGVAGGGYIDRPGEYAFDDDPEPAICQPGAPPEDDDSLERVEADARACAACGLSRGRKNAVPGEGARQPVVMIVGEGPGANEDESGRPFVGNAGQLLDRMLASIGLSRETNCFIANVVKCRPPQNRDPLPEETAACARLLERQARLLKPAFVLCAGRISAQTLLGSQDGIGKLRGKITEARIGGESVRLLATYHPSALLHDESKKRPAWEDLKLLRAALDEAGLARAEGEGG